MASALMFSFGGTSLAANTSEEAAKNTVQKYFTSMKNGDFSNAAELVKDLRYNNIEKQIEKYEQYSKDIDFESIEVLSAIAESDNKVTVTVREVDSGKTFEENIEVVKVGQEWKLILGEGDEATILALNAPEISVNAAVDYYEFSGLKQGVLYTDDAFEVTNSSNKVTISGWQNDRGLLHHTASVKYRVVEDVWYGWREWGVEFTETFDSDKNDSSTWYSHTFEGIPNGSDYHIRITGNSQQGYPMDGAGNVYQ